MAKPKLNMGEFYWKHPALDGLLFPSIAAIFSSAEREAERDTSPWYESLKAAGPLRAEDCVLTDTRPPIGEVLKWLEKTEGKVWDEYLSAGYVKTGRVEWADKWPSDWYYARVRVFVVTGGSEGLYLHVELTDCTAWSPASDPQKEDVLIIIGKTLNCSDEKWNACWRSAGHIARALGA